jgi:hypothetical protein
MTSNDRTSGKKDLKTEVIRYRLSHPPQGAFAATRPGSMVTILEKQPRTTGGDTMKRSNYLIWFRRLVVLGAVVAGLTASAAGAGRNVPDHGPYPMYWLHQVVTWPVKTGSAPKVDPLAVGYLIGYGLSPIQVTSWTTGACSHRAKAASCYAMFKPAWWSSATTSTTKHVTDSTGFQWGDAGIGAGLALGIVLLVGGAAAGLLISRRNGRQQAARA